MSFFKLFSGRKGKESANGFASEFTVKDPSAYDFLWTIKSFSKIVGDNEGKQASGRFKSKGHSWKLVMYPDGNIVHGQISLYLVLIDTSSHPSEAVFKVSYELFLFDQNTGGTISKKGTNLGQFDDAMGFRSMIDLKTFRDSSNKYLVKDTCMFAVKILQIVHIQTPIECLQLVEKVSHDYSWMIENFSKLDKKIRHRKIFTAGEYLWSIAIYPEGDQKSIQVKENNVSLFMHYLGPIHDDTSAMKISAEFTLSIIDQIEGNHKKRKFTGTEVFKCDHSWGWSNLMSLKDFNDSTRGFIVNDTCIIEAKVVVLALVK